MRSFFVFGLLFCALIFSASPSLASQLEATTCAGSPYPFQGVTSLCPGLTLPAVSACGSYAFPGRSAAPLNVYGDCVFIDNEGGDCNNIPFVPLGRAADWAAFKAAVQAGGGNLVTVRLNNYCRAETFTSTVCGQAVQPEITRNGDTATFRIGDREEIFTCTAGPNCSSSWSLTSSSGECPVVVAGTCGAAANSANRYTSEPSSSAKCAAGMPKNESGAGPWSWVCAGENGGADSGTCQAIGPDAACGGAHNTVLTAAPSVGAACQNSSAFASGPSLSGGVYSWVCAGQLGGSNSAQCQSRAPAVVDNETSTLRVVRGNEFGQAAFGGAKNIPRPHQDRNPYTYEGTARYVCARAGMGIVHDFGGLWGKRKGGGCDDSDADIFAAQYNGAPGNYAQMSNPNSYTQNWSRNDTNCTGDLSAVLCSGPVYYELTALNTLAGPTNTDPALAVPPAGLDECPAGINLAGGIAANPDQFFSIPTSWNGVGGGHSGTYQTGSQLEAAWYGSNTRYKPGLVLSKNGLNCYQRIVNTVSGCPIDPATGFADIDSLNPLPYSDPPPAGVAYCIPPFGFDGFQFDGACYLCNQAVSTTTYYSLYTATTQKVCVQSQTNPAQTGVILAPAACGNNPWGGYEIRYEVQNVNNQCGVNQEYFYCAPRSACEVVGDPAADLACAELREREEEEARRRAEADCAYEGRC